MRCSVRDFRTPLLGQRGHTVSVPWARPTPRAEGVCGPGTGPRPPQKGTGHLLRASWLKRRMGDSNSRRRLRPMLRVGMPHAPCGGPGLGRVLGPSLGGSVRNSVGAHEESSSWGRNGIRYSLASRITTISRPGRRRGQFPRAHPLAADTPRRLRSGGRDGAVTCTIT